MPVPISKVLSSSALLELGRWAGDNRLIIEIVDDVRTRCGGRYIPQHSQAVVTGGPSTPTVIKHISARMVQRKGIQDSPGSVD